MEEEVPVLQEVPEVEDNLLVQALEEVQGKRRARAASEVSVV